MAYLYPCALIQNFDLAILADTLTTEEVDKWSTTSESQLTPSLDYTTIHESSRRSLKLAYSASTASVYKGLNETKVTSTFWNNPYGAALTYTDADASWATNIGAWVYASSHDYADDNDLLKLGFSTAGGSDVTVAWNSSVGTTNKWCWMDEAISTNTGMDRAIVNVNSGATSGTLYLSNLLMFKRSASNVASYDASDRGGSTAATGQYNWKNGIGFKVTSLSGTNLGYSIEGKIFGSNIREMLTQLLQMETIDVKQHNMLLKPFPTYSTVRDYELKTYLFYQELRDGDDNLEFKAEPVVLTNLTYDISKGKVITFTAQLVRFVGY